MTIICVSYPMSYGFPAQSKDDWEAFCRKDKTLCSKGCRRNHLFNKIRFFDCSRVCKSTYMKCCEEMPMKPNGKHNATLINLTVATKPQGGSTFKTNSQKNLTNPGGANINVDKARRALIELTNATGTQANSTNASKASVMTPSTASTAMPPWNQQYPFPPTHGCSVVCMAERYTCQQECHLTPYDFGCLPECDVDYEDCERECFFRASFRRKHCPNCHTG